MIETEFICRPGKKYKARANFQTAAALDDENAQTCLEPISQIK
jgi:hypothetical protein